MSHYLIESSSFFVANSKLFFLAHILTCFHPDPLRWGGLAPKETTDSFQAEKRFAQNTEQASRDLVPALNACLLPLPHSRWAIHRDSLRFLETPGSGWYRTRSAG